MIFCLSKQQFRSSKEKSFTLLEVMMAIFVLTIAVGASYILIQKTFIASSLTQSKLVAYYLAQEGVENVRNIRDTNWLNDVPWNEGIAGVNIEHVNFLDGTQNKFERETSVAVNDNAMEVRVDVKWNEKGKNYNVEVVNYLYDWYSEPE
ncbi:prepilin-type N-terminal cleavage/methylation domain-containing protein [Candidatus Gottesmanbacteria bacterium]|nr:prepilin-type N-terminal cleavage/methylation domain-containing protein [Candidatus Gottesmanbacteria bacterium]